MYICTIADRDNILQRIKESVKSTAPGAELILYGSYARGDNNSDSDIDLLVLLDKDIITYEEEKKIKYPLYHIGYDTDLMISSMVLSKTSWETRLRITPFYANVWREGLIL